jgi:arylsulfatase A
MILSYILKILYLFVFLYKFSKVSSLIDFKPNVIIILCDDLGYGDLSFEPFNDSFLGNIIKTPELSKMASKGMILSNFHTASPLCSPSRASIMVGLFPWRMGVDFIYAGDLKLDGSEEIDHEQLPMIPNIAMSFRDANYYTAHIGKWHLGKYLLYYLLLFIITNII